MGKHGFTSLQTSPPFCLERPPCGFRPAVGASAGWHRYEVEPCSLVVLVDYKLVAYPQFRVVQLDK